MSKVVTARGVIRSFVERVERLEAEKKALSDDIAEVYKEAKGVGLDVPALRRQVKRRKIDRAKLQEMDALDELYGDALDDTPLGRAASAAPKQAKVVTKVTAPLPPHDPETGEIDEIPAGSHAYAHGQPDQKEEEASSAPAHGADGKGPGESPAQKHPASKPTMVASVVEPLQLPKVTQDTDLYLQGIRRTA